MKKSLGIILILIALFIIIFLGNIEKTDRVCFKKNCFDVEIADSSIERTKGLMFRDSLGENNGMFFVFDEPGIYSFWMKNTLVRLDIILLDKYMNVVFIEKNALPCGSDCLAINHDEEPNYV